MSVFLSVSLSVCTIRCLSLAITGDMISFQACHWSIGAAVKPLHIEARVDMMILLETFNKKISLKCYNILLKSSPHQRLLLYFDIFFYFFLLIKGRKILPPLMQSGTQMLESIGDNFFKNTKI